MNAVRDQTTRGASQEPWRYTLRDGQARVYRCEADAFLAVSVDAIGGYVDGFDYQAFKRWMCVELAAFLNGERNRPAWLADLARTSEVEALGVDGTRITAVDPRGDGALAGCLMDMLQVGEGN